MHASRPGEAVDMCFIRAGRFERRRRGMLTEMKGFSRLNKALLTWSASLIGNRALPAWRAPMVYSRVLLPL
jgi:hypothetical protein